VKCLQVRPEHTQVSTFQALHSIASSWLYPQTLGWKGLQGTNTLSFLRKSVNFGRKEFYSTGPRRQCFGKYSSLTKKLECLSLVSFSSLAISFVGKVCNLPKSDMSERTRVGSGVTRKLRRKLMLSIFLSFHNKFRTQCYKTFLFVIYEFS
jgi:hypothetical protein